MEAGDGTAGLKILKSGEPLDLLITDVGLPGLSGLQLAEAARASRPNLPILLITGYVGKSLETSRPAGAAEMGVLRKPFTLDELAARVQALLNRPHSRADRPGSVHIAILFFFFLSAGPIDGAERLTQSGRFSPRLESCRNPPPSRSQAPLSRASCWSSVAMPISQHSRVNFDGLIQRNLHVQSP